jgi:salicylate hydroxylase
MLLAGQDVIVIGAGVAGLAAACALGQCGARVTVLEQAGALEDVGAGIQISPNGAAVLHQLGLGDALNAVSMRAQAVELRDGYSGKPVTRLDLVRGRVSEGYHFLHRADLIGLLHAAALKCGATLRLNEKIDLVDLSGPRPRIVTAAGATHAPRLLVGADGLHSRVRGAVTGHVNPSFTRQVAWRTVIPSEPGADVVAEVHMGEGRHLVSYPLRGGTLRNIVAVEERTEWAAEGWSHRDDPAALRAAFAGFSPRVQAWLNAVEEVHLWGLFRHPVAPQWWKARPDGAAAIMGDAAHPMLPFLAQGANMALEDAAELDLCLAGQGTLADGLAAYQQRRHGRATRVIEVSSGNARAYHLSGWQRRVAHLGLRIIGTCAPDLLVRRFDWLYHYDVRTT